MAANPYDRFDSTPAPAAKANPYDRFDAPATPPLKAAEAPTRAPRLLDPFGIAPPLKDVAGASVEPLLSLGTGAVAGPLSGLAGIAGALLPGEEGQGKRWTESVGRSMTYEPRTAGGRDAMTAISYPFEKIGEGADYAGGQVTDATGSPGAGAAVNAGLQMLPQVLGAKGGSTLKKPPGPKVNPDVQTLIDRGMTLTPGQISPKLQRAEEALQSLPLAGDVVKDARNRGVRQFNTEAINDSLKPIGMKLPKGVEGETALAFAREQLGKRMDELTMKMHGELDAVRPSTAPALPGPGPTGAPALPGPPGSAPTQLSQPPKPTLRQELESLKQMAANSTDLPPDVAAKLGRVIDRDVIGKFVNGRADGATLQAIGTKLRTQVEKLSRSEDPDLQHLGEGVKEVSAAVVRMMEDVNPVQPEWTAAKDGWARFKIAQEAGASKGAKQGIFTPSQYDSSVRSHDKTKDKRAYSEGTARQQDLSNPAVARLAPTLADSGTPLRVSVMHALTDPKAMAALAAAGIPTAFLYSPAGVAFMQRMLTNPPGAGRMGAMGAAPGAAQYSQLPPPPPQ